jgi:hypothetical protein
MLNPDCFATCMRREAGAERKAAEAAEHVAGAQLSARAEVGSEGGQTTWVWKDDAVHVDMVPHDHVWSPEAAALCNL